MLINHLSSAWSFPLSQISLLILRTCLFICVSVCLPVCVSVHVSLYGQSAYLYVRLPVYICLCLPACLYSGQRVYVSACPFTYICLSVWRYFWYSWRTLSARPRIFMHVYIHIYMHIYMYVYIHVLRRDAESETCCRARRTRALSAQSTRH